MNFLSGCMAVCCLVAAVNFQMPEIHSDVQVNGGQQEVFVCDVQGYDDKDCDLFNANCTSGTHKVLHRVSPLPQLFRSLETLTVRGECHGNGGCFTPASPDITSAGCVVE